MVVNTCFYDSELPWFETALLSHLGLCSDFNISNISEDKMGTQARFITCVIFLPKKGDK